MLFYVNVLIKNETIFRGSDCRKDAFNAHIKISLVMFCIGLQIIKILMEIYAMLRFPSNWVSKNE